MTEHAGESAVQVSVGEEMEAYGDQAAAASIQFHCKKKGKLCNLQHRGNWQAQTTDVSARMR